MTTGDLDSAAIPPNGVKWRLISVADPFVCGLTLFENKLRCFVDGSDPEETLSNVAPTNSHPLHSFLPAPFVSSLCDAFVMRHGVG
jgi:hypothetical protein